MPTCPFDSIEIRRRRPKVSWNRIICEVIDLILILIHNLYIKYNKSIEYQQTFHEIICCTRSDCLRLFHKISTSMVFETNINDKLNKKKKVRNNPSEKANYFNQKLVSFIHL